MKKILLIDDDIDDAGIFREALEEIDPSVNFHHFDDGNEAIQALSNRHIPLPHLILLDINMPSISGWDCLKQFKKMDDLLTIPVIVYTTSSRSREVQLATGLGAMGLITKPDDYKKLKEIIATILVTPVEELPKTLPDLKS